MSRQQFPVLNTTDFVPWDFIEQHRKQIERNHYQSLEQVADRGGLSAQEMWCAINGRSFYDRPSVPDEKQCWQAIERLIARAKSTEDKLIEWMDNYGREGYWLYDPETNNRTDYCLVIAYRDLPAFMEIIRSYWEESDMFAILQHRCAIIQLFPILEAFDIDPGKFMT